MDTTKKNKNNHVVGQVNSKEREEFEKALNRKETNQESTKSINKELGTKIEYLKGIYKKDGAEKMTSQNRFKSDPSESLDEMINGMPSELIDMINDEIEFCLSRECDPDEVNNRVKKMIYLLQLAYKDPRKYLDMFGRNYQELLLSDFISEICDTEYTESDWHRIARLNFNLNGLRTVNNYGSNGRASGNELLETFSDILKNGRTVKALESLGVRVVSSAEGQDTFGWVLYGPYDLRLILSIAEELLLREAEETDVSHLIDFNDTKVKDVLKSAGAASKDGQKFRIMASIGSATLGEVLDTINLSEDTSYEEISKILMSNMFRAADLRARNFKEKFINKLKEENNALYHLYARSNIEMMEERVKELESRVNK